MPILEKLQKIPSPSPKVGHLNNRFKLLELEDIDEDDVMVSDILVPRLKANEKSPNSYEM